MVFFCVFCFGLFVFCFRFPFLFRNSSKHEENLSDTPSSQIYSLPLRLVQCGCALTRMCGYLNILKKRLNTVVFDHLIHTFT